MPTVNPYFTQGTANEQFLIEDIIIESLKIYGKEVFYIPRTLISRDNILGEDRLSKFKDSYPIEAYFENVESFGGQGAFLQKFGLMMEQSATLVVARRRWEEMVGRHSTTILPNRPCEGDLIYYPLTEGLFEIKFVKHQDPFYQLGKLYVYKLEIELFQYSSERFSTGVDAVDQFEDLKTFSTDEGDSYYAGRIKSVTVDTAGTSYTAPVISFTGDGTGATATATIGATGIITAIDMVTSGTGYTTAAVVITDDDGAGAAATAVLETDIDAVESYGDNKKFTEEGVDVVFAETNPFGDIE